MQQLAAMNQPEHDYTNIPDEYRWLLDEPLDRVLCVVSGSIRELVELVGLEATIKIVARFGGQPVYIQQWDGAFRELRNERIRKEFTGNNHAALTRRFGLSLSTIYEILRRPPEHKQDDLFGAGE